MVTNKLRKVVLKLENDSMGHCSGDEGPTGHCAGLKEVIEDDLENEN
jgi:hypothetical protein